MDQKGDNTTQEDNSSKEVGDAEGHKETKGSSEPEKDDNTKVSEEEAAIQQAEDDGITKNVEGEEGLSGKNVDLERGKTTNLCCVWITHKFMLINSYRRLPGH